MWATPTAVIKWWLSMFRIIIQTEKHSPLSPQTIHSCSEFLTRDTVQLDPRNKDPNRYKFVYRSSARWRSAHNSISSSAFIFARNRSQWELKRSGNEKSVTQVSNADARCLMPDITPLFFLRLSEYYWTIPSTSYQVEEPTMCSCQILFRNIHSNMREQLLVVRLTLEPLALETIHESQFTLSRIKKLWRCIGGWGGWEVLQD